LIKGREARRQIRTLKHKLGEVIRVDRLARRTAAGEREDDCNQHGDFRTATGHGRRIADGNRRAALRRPLLFKSEFD
jgi:hypothetical protein